VKIFHLSDLHIGKMLHRYDISDIQKDVFGQIIETVKKHRPDVIVIAGDIYDKAAPSGEAFDIFDDFLVSLASLEFEVQVMIISGNHDNNQRLGYASSFMKKSKIHIASKPPRREEEYLMKITLEDDYGEVDFYLLPFVRPADARNLLGNDVTIKNYDRAVAVILERENIDYSKRNVLVAHQFFVNSNNAPVRRDSEMSYISVGGIDSVDICHVKEFDYVALGHLHSAQSVGEDYIRYCGTPIKYSVSEANDEKCITVIDLKEKNTPPDISFVPLRMNKDVKKIKGTLKELIERSREFKDDYVSLTVTDEEVLFRPKEKLGECYNNILEVIVDNTRTRAFIQNDMGDAVLADPLTLFEEFYFEMNGQQMSDNELELLNEIVDEVTKNADGRPE